MPCSNLFSSLVFCLWILWRSTTEVAMRSIFVDGWTVNGHVLAKDRLDWKLTLLTKVCYWGRPRVSLCLYALFLLPICVCADVAPFGDCDSIPVPYQQNASDAGVFVCRYAYSLFVMRHLKFTWDDACERFLSLITRGAAFQFDLADETRIREEFGTLIDRLARSSLHVTE